MHLLAYKILVHEMHKTTYGTYLMFIVSSSWMYFTFWTHDEETDLAQMYRMVHYKIIIIIKLFNAICLTIYPLSILS